MGFLIGLVVVLAVLFGLAWIGQRQRRGMRPDQLSRAPGGGMAERNATGATVTGSTGVNDAPGSF